MESNFRIETLGGGITLMVIEGVVGKINFDLFSALSHLSKKRTHALIDLSNLEEGDVSFYEHLRDLSVRMKMKIIATNKVVIQKCNDISLRVYPTTKSASLSYAGDETINLLLRRLRDVPILNAEAYELIGYTSLPDATFEELEAKIKDNSGLCSQIFRMANSSFFCRTSPAETLNQAMVTLGFTMMRQVFLYNFYNSVSALFQAQEALIDHGKQCAILAEFISKSGEASKEECSKVRLGGLLHDIGRQALAFFFPEQYARVMQSIIDEPKPSYLAELMVFGTEHQQVGSLLCSRWNFPKYLSAVLADHHYLQAANWNSLTLPIFVANNYLHERLKEPCSPYFQKLEGYFFLKAKELPWEGDKVKEAFETCLEKNSL